MGYESRIYIVAKRNKFEWEEQTYANVIAMFDMCKCYFLSDALRKKPKTDCYFYADDGNTRILEDRYGEALTEATPKDVIDILEGAIAKGEDYIRVFPLLSALKTIDEQQANEMYYNVAVLHYGY